MRLAKTGWYAAAGCRTFESYIESRKLSVPRARPARTASRPARLEAALASPQRARTKGVRRQPVAFESNMQQGYRSVQRPANERGLEKRSSACRAQFSALKLCHGPLVRPFCFLSAAGALAVGKGVRVRPLVFLSAAGALLWFLSCCRRKRGKRGFCGWPLPLDRFSAESYAQQVFEHSRPAQLRGSWCSGITPAQHARGAGFNPRPVHAHVRLRLSQFASPWSFIPLGLLCVLPRPAGTPRPGAKRHF